MSRVQPLHTPLFFLTDTATTEIYTLSLHDALPISATPRSRGALRCVSTPSTPGAASAALVSISRMRPLAIVLCTRTRSEEHTSELQSRVDLVCRLLLEKKKQTKIKHTKR